jgi:hypothetical protein
VVTFKGPRNAYKDMLDNVVSPIACVSMNHQNQLEQMANGAMFATALPAPAAGGWRAAPALAAGGLSYACRPTTVASVDARIT